MVNVNMNESFNLEYEMPNDASFEFNPEGRGNRHIKLKMNYKQALLSEKTTTETRQAVKREKFKIDINPAVKIHTKIDLGNNKCSEVQCHESHLIYFIKALSTTLFASEITLNLSRQYIYHTRYICGRKVICKWAW